MTDLDRVRDGVLQRADIVVHAERAGFRRRGKAWFCGFHDNQRTPAASVRKGRVHCFGACGRNWDVIDLTMQTSGLDYLGALRVLAQEYCIPFEVRQLTPAEKRDYGERRRVAERVARPIGQAAYHWYRGRIAELTDLKRETVEDDRLNLSALAPAARELHRLEHQITPEGIVREYLAAVVADPIGTAAIVETQRAWGDACSVAVDAVLRQIGRRQRQEARSADAA